jgi:hypothetical protein
MASPALRAAAMSPPHGLGSGTKKQKNRTAVEGYSITSSARARSVAGTVRPRARAVLSSLQDARWFLTCFKRRCPCVKIRSVNPHLFARFGIAHLVGNF